MDHQRPANGHSLLLTTRQLIRILVQELFNPQRLRHLLEKGGVRISSIQIQGNAEIFPGGVLPQQVVRLKDKANGDEIAEAMLDGIDMHKWVCVAADKASVATFDDKVLFVMADSELVDVDALMTDAANALGVTFGYNMSKESAEDYGELPDELLATPAVVG